jgi:hypothetical protein
MYISKNRPRLHKFWQRILTFSCLVILHGCATNYYLTETKSFVATGARVSDALATAITTQQQVMRAEARLEATKDKSCAIVEKSILVRHAEVKFTSLVSQFLPQSPVCRQVMSCESNPKQPQCTGACMTPDEVQCIGELGTQIAKATNEGSDAFKLAARKASGEYINLVNRVSVFDVAIGKSAVTSTAFNTLAIYLELLSELAKPEQSTVEQKIKKLKKESDKALTDLQSFTNNSAVSEDSVKLFGSFKEKLTAVGTLAALLDQTIKNRDAIDQIRAVVLKQKNIFPELALDLGAILKTESFLAGADENRYFVKRAMVLQDLWKTADVTARESLLDTRQKLIMATEVNANAVVDQLIKALTDSHQALINLLEGNFSKEQKLALDKEARENFSDVVDAVFAVFNLFK